MECVVVVVEILVGAPPPAAASAELSTPLFLLLPLRGMDKGTIATACMAELRKDGRPGSWLCAAAAVGSLMIDYFVRRISVLLQPVFTTTTDPKSMASPSIEISSDLFLSALYVCLGYGWGEVKGSEGELMRCFLHVMCPLFHYANTAKLS